MQCCRFFHGRNDVLMVRVNDNRVSIDNDSQELPQLTFGVVPNRFG
jgi:hypothetical protein